MDPTVHTEPLLLLGLPLCSSNPKSCSNPIPVVNLEFRVESHEPYASYSFSSHCCKHYFLLNSSFCSLDLSSLCEPHLCFLYCSPSVNLVRTANSVSPA